MGKNTYFVKTFNYKVIYAFTIDDEKHRGLIKIGDATLHTNLSIDRLMPNSRELNQAALKRIKEYTNTAGVTINLLHTELAIKENKKKDGTIELKAFRDHEVHRVLENSGINKAKLDGSTGKEWYKIDLTTTKKAIEAVKNYIENLSNVKTGTHVPIVFRPEQVDAIEKTVKQFKKNDRMLWNAKMRFGKTLSALEVIKKCKFKKSIIVTHRPVVNDGWYEDFNKIFNGTEYIYGSKTNGNSSVKKLNDSNKSFVYFASIQDLRGSEKVGGRFNKNDEIFKTVWDLVIVDEAHEGTKTSLGDETIRSIFKEELKQTKLLSLSGTPFNILDEYEEDSIYTWDYIMEQENKSEWDKLHFGDSNPYEELPELRIFTYNLGDLLSNPNYRSYEDKAFNFHEFFRTWTGDFKLDYIQMPKEAKIGDFVHEKDVISLLNLMCKEDENNNYPYSKEEYRELFKHSLWMVPGVKEAKALKELMSKHSVFGSGQFNIVNVAGNEDEESADALNSVKTAIADAEKTDTYTITLSCGKLTTGVTIKEWTAVFMLSGSFSTSAANYLQTIFRVQSPCNKNGMIKNIAYVFDFAPDRTLKMVTQAVSVSAKAGKTGNEDKAILNKFLNFCPVIGISGSKMKEYKADLLLQQLKKAYADKVVRNGFDDSNLYNDELLKLDELDIQKFDHLKGIIGSSRAQARQNDIKVNEQGLTNEEYEKENNINKKPKRERTPEEEAFLEEMKKKKKVRNDAISILRGISIRMPMLIYGADVPYDEEITLDKFVEKVDDSSWKEFMPSGVTKEIFKYFRKYYDEDVFISAGRRIRNIARAADTLEPTKRTQKIASLFANFKNPDKETVLTPWRVVNMHMSTTLGGYDFWDEKYENELDNPRFVDRGKVTESTFSNINSKILEINSKTGLYPLYVTYSIYRKKCEKYKPEELKLELQQKLWKETILNNVYVICKTPMAKQITQRTLAGYSNIKINAHYFDDLINQMEHKQKDFIDKVLRASYWKKGEVGQMKFDAIVGNPPYQENIENRGEQPPVYNLFYDASIKMSELVTLITPARFLFDAGKTPSEWNRKMLNDEHFSVVKYFSESKDVFDTVDIKGGVSITIWNENDINEPIKVFTPNKTIKQIINKVTAIEQLYFSDIMYSNTSYKYSPMFFGENKEFEDRVSGGSKRYLSSSCFDKFPEAFIDNPSNNDDYYKIIGRKNNERTLLYFKKIYLLPPSNFDKFKIVLPSSNGSGALGEVISGPFIGEPYVGFTETFVTFGAFDTLAEAKNALKYIKTKFARMMLGTKKVTQGNKNAKVWSNVPLLNFDNLSEIDWSKSISEIDQQLYKKYELSDKEIKFIEEKIKPMN